MNSEKPVFIWAPAQRCGTGLLQRLVTSSKEVIVFGEDRFFTDNLPNLMLEHAEHAEQIAQLEIAERELARRLRELPARRATLLARQATAEARGARTSKGLHGADSVGHALEAFERMESKVIAAEVEAEVCASDFQLGLAADPFSPHRTQNALAELKTRSRGQMDDGKSVAVEAEADALDTLVELKKQLTGS